MTSSHADHITCHMTSHAGHMMHLRPPVVSFGDGVKPLCSCCVPYLKSHGVAIHSQVLLFEINPYGNFETAPHSLTLHKLNPGSMHALTQSTTTAARNHLFSCPYVAYSTHCLLPIAVHMACDEWRVDVGVKSYWRIYLYQLYDPFKPKVISHWCRRLTPAGLHRMLWEEHSVFGTSSLRHKLTQQPLVYIAANAVATLARNLRNLRECKDDFTHRSLASCSWTHRY